RAEDLTGRRCSRIRSDAVGELVSRSSTRTEGEREEDRDDNAQRQPNPPAHRTGPLVPEPVGNVPSRTVRGPVSDVVIGALKMNSHVRVRSLEASTPEDIPKPFHSCAMSRARIRNARRTAHHSVDMPPSNRQGLPLRPETGAFARKLLAIGRTCGTL